MLSLSRENGTIENCELETAGLFSDPTEAYNYFIAILIQLLDIVIPVKYFKRQTTHTENKCITTGIRTSSKQKISRYQKRKTKYLQSIIMNIVAFLGA